MNYDVVFFHPPAIYDFRTKPIFPGLLGATVEQIQYSKVPVGILGIADYLDRHGYKVVVDNLSDRMINQKEFNVEEHIKNTSTNIYGIDLHWHHHAQGAIEIARLCKKLHPESLVVMGGLTSTYFHEEIIRKYEFIDAVVRGEGEKPFLELLRTLEKYGKLTESPSLTFRNHDNSVCITPLMTPTTSLDEFEFIRFDLLDPQTCIFDSSMQSRWSIPVCRGCKYNCVTCGGSAYSYKKYFGMSQPSFRSPSKILGDIKKLNEQGIHRVGLYQDPRMAGESYWRELMATLRQEKLEVEQLTMDLLAPADEEYIREIATIGKPVVLYICPDAGSVSIRKAQGRNYSNEDLLNTIKLCHRYHIPVTTFFSTGLAGETSESIKETWNLWNSLCNLDQAALRRGGFGNIGNSVLKGGPIIGPIIIEPGSLACDYPDKYGYKLIYKNLKEYIAGLSQPSWHQWLNHETEQLNKDALLEFIFEAIENSIGMRMKFGSYNKPEATVELFRTEADRVVIDESNQIMNLTNEEEKNAKLKSLKEARDSFFNSSPFDSDSYGYKEKLWRKTVLMHQIHGW
jgi:B12-binding domain/radical SAM domain protein